jgi:hypothetical protein
MTFPKRIEFGWLRRTLPSVTSLTEFDAIVDELRKRGWKQLDPPSNFLGLMEALLPLAIQQQAIARRVAQAA